MPLMAAIAFSAALTQTHLGDVAEVPAHIQPMGWTYYGSTPRDYIFFQVHPQQPVFWIRAESIASNDLKSRSYQWEVDCASERVRQVHTILSSEHNLNQVEYIDAEDRDWQYPNPEAVAGVISDALCKAQGR